MGSSGVYSAQAQLSYVVSWFEEWSELQRKDFLPILAQKQISSGYVNGLVPAFSELSYNRDRPPSLFQCRIKLFHEWWESWSETEREQLLLEIKQLDGDFFIKLEEELRDATGHEDNPSSIQSQGREIED